MRILGLLVTVLASICIAHFIRPLPSGITWPTLIIALVLMLSTFYHQHESIWLWIGLGAYGWASQNIHAHIVLEQPVTCSALIQLVDFPKQSTPSGEKVAAKILETKDCPLQSNDIIMIRSYSRAQWAINNSYYVSLKLLPVKSSSLGKMGVDAYANLVSILSPATIQSHGIIAWRAKASKLIDQHYQQRTQRWWQALLIGYRGQLTSEDWQILRRTGTVHLLAISGLHLAIVAGMTFWLLQMLWAQSRFLSTRVEPRSAALLGALFMTLFYSLISGAQPPVLRAWLMFVIFTLHWFYAPIRSGIQALIVTALVLLIADTFIIYSVSAWLSFFATTIVILSYRKLKHLRPLYLWISLQAIITFAMWPLIWALFGGISLIAFVANLIVIPWLGFVLLLGYVGLIFPRVASISDSAFSRYLHTLNFFAESKSAYWMGNWQPNMWIAVCLSSAIVLWLAPKHIMRNYAILMLMSLAISSAIYSVKTRQDYHVFQQSPLLAMLHVDGHTYLINAGYRGGSYDQAQTEILPYLRQRGLQPQAMIITDHRKRATTALTTLINHYPDMALYGVVLTQSLPFEVTYCPQETLSPLIFVKDRYCEAFIADKWRIQRDGVQQISNTAQENINLK